MRKVIIGVIMGTCLALAGCRSPGLPPEPPEQDASNPEAGVVEVRPQGNPFTRSAFEGVKLDGAGGHHHHHHHGAKKEGEATGKVSHASHAAKGGRS